MKQGRAAWKRLLTAIGISLAVHAAGIVVLGMWSLKTPAVHEHLPPLTVFLEPDVIPQPVIKKTEKLPSARKVSKPVSRPAPPTAPKTAPASVSTPQKHLPAPPPSEETSVKGPDTTLKIAPESSEPLTSVKPAPLPKPKGSKIVYADTSSSGEAPKTPAPAAEPSPSVISSAELNAFASSIRKAGASPRENTEPEVTDNTAGTAAVPLPDTVSLDLNDSSNTRRPVSKFVLNIPEEMLRKIGHDSFLTVSFTLTPDGYILDPKVVVSQVSPQIEARVLEALRKWEFNTGSSSDGNVKGQITIRFKVK